jgi:hypothetical protein
MNITSHHLISEKTIPFLGAAVLDQSDFFEMSYFSS